jgi:mannosyl-oligosaccharide alpha-1,2-mannosidase
MAIKRRRLLYSLVAAILITLWWRYGLKATSTTRHPHTTVHDSKLGDEVESGRVKVFNARPKEAPQRKERPDPAKSREKYLLSTFMTLPSGSPATIPQIQFPFPREDAGAFRVQKDRLAAVKEAFIHSWNGYKKYAWLKDELAPLTGGHRDTLCGWAVSLVDSLDSLFIMGLEKEFHEAVNAATTINFGTPASLPINVFETTIRLLGGFLGAYDVSGGSYPILLEKAREIGEVSRQLRLMS